MQPLYCTVAQGLVTVSPHPGEYLDVVNYRQGIGDTTNGHHRTNEESLNLLHMVTCLSSLRCGLLTLRGVPKGRSFGTRP